MIFEIIPVFFLNLKCIKEKEYVAGDDITLHLRLMRRAWFEDRF